MTEINNCTKNNAINDRDIANAKLIVAAPDMLEALKWFCDLVDDVDDGEVSIRKTYARFKEIINRIEAHKDPHELSNVL